MRLFIFVSSFFPLFHPARGSWSRFIPPLFRPQRDSGTHQGGGAAVKHHTPERGVLAKMMDSGDYSFLLKPYTDDEWKKFWEDHGVGEEFENIRLLFFKETSHWEEHKFKDTILEAEESLLPPGTSPVKRLKMSQDQMKKKNNKTRPYSLLLFLTAYQVWRDRKNEGLAQLFVSEIVSLAADPASLFDSDVHGRYDWTANVKDTRRKVVDGKMVTDGDEFVPGFTTSMILLDVIGRVLSQDIQLVDQLMANIEAVSVGKEVSGIFSKLGIVNGKHFVCMLQETPLEKVKTKYTSLMKWLGESGDPGTWNKSGLNVCGDSFISRGLH